MKHRDECPECYGTGVEMALDCNACDGEGWLYVSDQPCSFCDGSGEKFFPCSCCDGKGTYEAYEAVNYRDFLYYMVRGRFGMITANLRDYWLGRTVHPGNRSEWGDGAA